MKRLSYTNAAKRKTFVGDIFEVGTHKLRDNILKSINHRFMELHQEGYLHIHDLEGYGLTYNCLTPDVLKNFPYRRFQEYSETRKILEVINYYQYIISNLANEQTGGIAFGNFDEEIDFLFKELSIPITDFNLELLRSCIESFINWINSSRTRYGQECYYVSLNLGLSTGTVGRYVTESVLMCFINSSSDVIRPNIIFKVKEGINYLFTDNNYDLFILAVKCTAKKMIPTYLLCDSKPNQGFNPYNISIMGCRTRVVRNEYGEETSIGRGNIAYITINLPRIALEIDTSYREDDIETKINLFKKRWQDIAKEGQMILLDRYKRLLECCPEDFPFNQKQNLWVQDFTEDTNIEDVFKNGTLSVGFIGLSEAVEILTGNKYYSSESNYQRAIEMVEFMRETIDGFGRETHLNFTLLATSGEYISGRFPALDNKCYANALLNKGFYTNSFHVDVNSLLHPLEKVRYEGLFHNLCNGGCITYVEFSSAPLENYEAILEIIEAGINYGVSYLGINYPMDICNNCGIVGTFDHCSKCGSNNIKRIRRVSGYLEDIYYFTKGKQAEVAYRRPNVTEG